MDIEQLSPQATHDALDSDSQAVYLDVRTVEEFADGHPAGAINIPITILGPDGGMLWNPEFLIVVEAVLSRDRRILCGCKSGGRSQMAAEVLLEHGYRDIANVSGGFCGAHDSDGHLAIPGWKEAGLPSNSDVDETNSYAALKQAVQQL